MNTTPRLPVPGEDKDTWGDILNQYLEVSLGTDGTLKPGAVTEAGGVLSSQVGQPSGVAELNSSGLVPTNKLATGTANNTNFLRGDGTWATPAVPVAAQKVFASYYSTNYPSIGNINNGDNAISFDTVAINVGSAVTVSGATITISVNGTYLFSVSGIVQEYLYESDQATTLHFSAGFRSQYGSNSWTDVPPYPTIEHLTWTPADTSGEIAGNYATASMNVSQMVSVTNAPVTFNLIVNNSSSSYSVSVMNPTLNIIKLD